MDENPQQILLCTCPNEAAGQMIAERLVRDGLAACVNIVPGLKSVFMWEGRCEIDSEVLLVIKTRRDVYEAVERAILADHPYELPEIVTVPITGGLAGYLSWIDEVVANP